MKKNMHPLKADHCYAVLDISGMAGGDFLGVAGFFFRDTRHLNNYRWNMDGFDLIHCEEGPKTLVQFWSRFANHEQQLLIRREITLRPDGFDDELIVQNSSRKSKTFIPDLSFDADFVDVFELRGTARTAKRNKTERKENDKITCFSYLAQDGAELDTIVKIAGADLGKPTEINSGESCKISVSVQFSSSLVSDIQQQSPIIWTSSKSGQAIVETGILSQARIDIETLCLSTESGTCIGAGIPNFVTMFGRDSLITAWFLLSEAPELAKGVLKFLAKHQGKKDDEFHDEQKGKILHEFREGELSRLGELPFAPYFGSVDATPLFLRVLSDYIQITGDNELAFELEDNWRGALDWIKRQRDEKGFLRYTGAQDGKGLINKCWKDSNDSMSYSDGSLAGGALAIIEVQGYLCAAYEAGAHLNDTVSGAREQSEKLIALRHQTIEAIDRYFWMPDKHTYALALDKDGNRLDVVSSNPGHLLWSGAVKKTRVEPLIGSMFDEVLWSGWGLRTLSASEERYNPLSYHNGSIWPHDTAIFGAGLFRYGHLEQFAKVTQALSDLANIQHDFRLPELVGGYERHSNIPPLPYVESCRPQAWAAASLIFMLHPHRAQKSASRDVAAA